MKENPWLRGLNDEQKHAVLHNFGPLLILAGAGSGKTTVLVARMGRLIADQICRPDEITVLTFTNKAAREMKERVIAKLGKSAKRISAGTFHSFGLQMLKAHYKEARLPKQFGIIDAGDAKAVLRDLIKEISHFAKDSFDLEKLLAIINRWRETGVERSLADDPYEDLAEILLPKYIKKLELLGVVDFEDLILRPIELLEKHSGIRETYHRNIQQLMVDEFQDTNSLQMKLVKLLAGEEKNLTVVGDDDQSIYGWRGAEVQNILNFPKYFKGTEVVRLERNYRSTEAILSIANAVIQKNSHRHDKVLIPSGYEDVGATPESFVYESDEEEVENISDQIQFFLNEGYHYKDIAILYRSNSQGGLLEGEFRRTGIPYSLTGGSAFFDRREVKDILAFLRSAISPNEISVRRTINIPPRGIGETTIKAIEEYGHEHHLGFPAAAHRWNKTEIPEKTGEKIESYFQILKELPEYVLMGGPDVACGDRLVEYFVQIGYRDFIFKGFKDGATALKRWRLIEVLGRVLDSFVGRGGKTLKTLKEFIDCMELRDTVDEGSAEETPDKVQLLTLHACKGLEFPVTIMIGLEEDIIPHRTLGTSIDEERRLFYVGVTRAKERLVFTRARKRKRYGVWRPSAPSRFLLEVPESLVSAYDCGFRPLRTGERETLLADLFKKLEKQS
ncbi:MAG: ATP-dependent helicase, partial [Bdellovibrionales bacterium]|nr:ATP-dependent helicase [Bdellovibrionales bacterium]